MTNIEALKNLYVANGGDRADVEDMNLSSEVYIWPKPYRISLVQV